MRGRSLIFGCHNLTYEPSIAAQLIGRELLEKIAAVSIELYTRAAAYAESRGVILVDTKFEFGTLTDGSLILIDEVLTPDSSRYWPLTGYMPGQPQTSFDKQFLRDWLVGEGFVKGLEDGKEGKGWTISEEVVNGTSERYQEVLELLTMDKL